MDTQTYLKKFLNDPRIYKTIEEIGQMYALNIDQMGMLDEEIQKILLGESKATEFAKNIDDLLGIGRDKSRQITEELNKRVMGMIQAEYQPSKEAEDRAASIEKENGVEIEPSVPAADAPGNLPGAESVESRHDIMAGIENPEPVQMRPAGDTVPQPFRQAPPPTAPQEPKSEPLVDQLLHGSTVIPEQKIVKQAPPESSVKPTPPKPAAGDPYREAVE